jgi:unsaturated rhamnogalacturonyl hydrolase
MKLYRILIIPFLLGFNSLNAQSLSEKMAKTMMETHVDSIAYFKEGGNARWNYEQGILLKAIEELWYKTADPKYFEYVQKHIDRYVINDGKIQTYEFSKFNSDLITPGRTLLTLYKQTLNNKEKYRIAADTLYKQIQTQPRTKQGGFWHKDIYPNQMWLDGLYMVEPFYAEYAAMFNKSKDFDDIINQFVWMEQNGMDPKTGLLYHGYDESRVQKWSNPETGRSPHVWTRAMGWYLMALVDVLDYIPEDYPKRNKLIGILNRSISSIMKYQDPASGCWWDITDLGTRKGNYLEASGSCMVVYSAAKAMRKGYIPMEFAVQTNKAWAGIQKEFVSKDAKGDIHLEKTVLVSGLGGKPYRDGSFEYYMSEKLRQDDLKGVGPYIFAALEMEKMSDLNLAQGKVVGIDNYFNCEYRSNWNKSIEKFHYTWDDTQHSGFLWWANIFKDYGAKLTTINNPPTVSNLKGLDVYIIVDPDTKKETESPNFVNPSHINAIKNWVNNGGTLILMANDTSNCEIPKFNELAKVFGIEFSLKSINMVQGNNFEQGLVNIPPNSLVFPNTKAVYVKELVTLNIKPNVKKVATKSSDVIMASVAYGKGKVFVIGDPWLYNEYVDGRKIPMSFQNFNAAKDLAKWSLK